MNIRYLVLILSAIALMGCASGGGTATTCETGESLINGVCTDRGTTDNSGGSTGDNNNGNTDNNNGNTDNNNGNSDNNNGNSDNNNGNSGNTASYAEYTNNSVLEKINAGKAYARGHTGEGQVIAVYQGLDPAALYGDPITGYDPDYAGLTDVFVAGVALVTSETAPIGGCKSSACRMNSFGFSHYFNGMAGRKEGTGIHGVAYDAQVKMITLNSIGYAETKATIIAGSKHDGNDVTAIIFNPTYRVNNPTYGIKSSSLKGNYYKPSSVTSNSYDAGLQVVATTNTLIISYAGNNGVNSVTGKVAYYNSRDDRADNVNPQYAPVTDFYSAPANQGNLSQFSSYVTNTTYAGKWIVAVGVDENNLILQHSNGCGAARQYCLSVPEIATALNDSTTMLAVNPAYTLGGALAVMKNAYPNLNSTQLVRLALGTADYIDGTGEVDDTIKGKYNYVYGHGLLNLDAATSLSADDAGKANVIASSASPIGALWGETQLTLSSHFGSQLNSVNLGVEDKYGRHFVLEAQNIAHENVAIGLDEYMAGLLGDDVQSEKLGAQAQANYSNTGEQNWMNLEYTSGKATSKIAFQDNYKIKPLHNDSAASILRANHIRPASNNIGMMDVDYALNGNLSLSSYAARGEYDTGYKFDELGTDFDVNYKKSHLNIAIGNIREHDQFLGTHTTGGYALNAPTVSRFTDVTYGHDVGAKFNIYANYINYETDVDMLYDQFASIDGLQADQYQIGFTGKNLMSDDDNLNIALITKLGVTDGALNQNTTLGYTADGAFNDVSQSYDLAVSERHQQFEITYQGKIYQNSQDGVSVLKDNRFFTTIRVDQNLNHVQGASQTEIVSGVSARF